MMLAEAVFISGEVDQETLWYDSCICHLNCCQLSSGMPLMIIVIIDWSVIVFIKWPNDVFMSPFAQLKVQKPKDIDFITVFGREKHHILLLTTILKQLFDILS